MLESRISGRAFLRLGGMQNHGNYKQKGYMGSFFLPVTVRSVLPRGADWVLPRRHPPLIRRHEGSASHHLPRRAAAVKQDVRQGELHFVLLVIGTFLSL